MAAYGDGEFCRAIHNIENSPFRTKFERDVEEMKGNLGIGCISDYEPQPLLIQSHHGSFAIVTVGRSIMRRSCSGVLSMKGIPISRR